MPRFSVLFRAVFESDKNLVNATENDAHTNTHAVIEARNSLAIVDFVLLKQVDEVKNTVTLPTNENIGLSHFLLGFYKRSK